MTTLIAFRIVPGRGDQRGKVVLTWGGSRPVIIQNHSVFFAPGSTIDVGGHVSYTWTEEIEVEDAAHLEQLKRTYHPDCMA